MTNLTAIIAGGGTVPTWVSGTAYVVDDDVFSPASGHLYRCIVDVTGTTDPSADATNWLMIGSAGIKSIQRGVITITSGGGLTNIGTATLSPAVDVSKTELRYVGQGNNYDAVSGSASLVLTNTTTVTATRIATSATSDDTYVSWEVTERW